MSLKVIRSFEIKVKYTFQKLEEKVDSLVNNSFLNNPFKLCFFLDYPWLAAPGDKVLQIPDKVWF